jgi:UDP-N-acetylglucosamine--N-acetylmuramyl-(pentapeptide) pyrophosphoryl-undecaprenol N-acetylglucosamine transferase
VTGAAEKREVFALITGGGTGGHVYAGLALAQALVARGHDPDEIHWVGASRGMEASLVPKAGITIDLLPGRGLQRRLTPANISVVGQTGKALARVWRLVRRLRPSVVVGVGGYASLPCVVAARLQGVPVVVHEQNAAPGLANRTAVRLGAKAAVSLPGTPLAGAEFTGNPVRAEIAGVSRHPSPERPLLAVFGGSLGARRLNHAALELYDLWRDRAGVAVHHVTGAAGHDDCAGRLAGLRRHGDVLSYELVRYQDDMAGLYSRASLALCRAGATTVAELAAARLPAVLVPLPGAPNDHQTGNAMALVEAGAGVLVPDADCRGARLAEVIGPLLGDPERLRAMGEAAGKLARPDAADRLADLVEEHAARGR